VLGAYPSALHVRWAPPTGTGIAALAVDNEPEPFWTGDDEAFRIEEWKRRIGFRPEWGSVGPAGDLNGSSGRWVERHVLAPLGARRNDTWITDSLDTYRVSAKQKRALDERFDDFAERAGIDRPDLTPHPSEAEIVREAKRDHLDRLRRELHDARPLLVVTLGNAALRVMREIVATPDGAPSRLNADLYGNAISTQFERRTIPWFPLAHPASPPAYQDAHLLWEAGTGFLRGKKRPRWARRRTACPACGATPLRRITYGLPWLDPELQFDMAAGFTEIGGCIIDLNDPAWQCAECGATFDGERRPL
jgi:hypothetical protein